MEELIVITCFPFELEAELQKRIEQIEKQFAKRDEHQSIGWRCVGQKLNFAMLTAGGTDLTNHYVVLTFDWYDK